jgi:protein-tyrosine kinase
VSLIEEALRKAEQHRSNKRESQGKAPPRIGARHSTAHAPPSEPVEPTSTRQFRLAPFDSELMESNFVLARGGDKAALRAYKILRTRVLQRLTANAWRSVAVTSTSAGEGKTLTAINFSIALAQNPNTHVFLVDLDLQRPRVANYLGMKFDRGLSDYLAGTCDLSSVIYGTEIPRLAILPNARPIENSSEVLASRRISDLVAGLEAETPQRVIIYDLPPLLLSDDVLIFAPQADSALLVIAEGTTPRALVDRAKEALAEMNVIGIALNRSHERDDSSYYY